MRAVWYRVRCLVRTGWRATLATVAIVALVSGLVLTLTAGAMRTVTAADRYVRQPRGA